MRYPISMKLLIVDDQIKTRRSLAILFKTVPGVDEIYEAGDGLSALSAARELHPDVVLMDARMPFMDGLTATRMLKSEWPKVKVIVLSMYMEYQYIADLSGADAFISKGEPPEKLVEMFGKITAAAPQI